MSRGWLEPGTDYCTGNWDWTDKHACGAGKNKKRETKILKGLLRHLLASYHILNFNIIYITNSNFVLFFQTACTILMYNTSLERANFEKYYLVVFIKIQTKVSLVNNFKTVLKQLKPV